MKFKNTHRRTSPEPRNKDAHSIYTFLTVSVALSDILDAFDLPENERRIEEARDSAGNDMLKMMQIVFPITTQIQMSVIGKYGFPEDGDGNHALT